MPPGCFSKEKLYNSIDSIIDYMMKIPKPYKKKYYNIASRAAQSNSVYVSVLKIPIVHADSVSNSVSNIVVRFSRRF